MKLISLNIENNRHHGLVLPFLKSEKPDVICLQELLEEDFLLYKSELNLNGIFQPWSCIRSKSPYPDLIGKKQGLAIFAKNIVEHGSIFYAGKEENILKSFDEFMSDESFQKNKAILWADVIDNNCSYKICTTQLPVTREGSTTPYQLEVTNSLINSLDSFNEFVLCGDMNAPRGKEAFSLLAEKYKDNIPQEYLTSIDQKLHRVSGIILMVDGLFTTSDIIASNVKLVDGVSDHMAIIANIIKKPIS